MTIWQYMDIIKPHAAYVNISERENGIPLRAKKLRKEFIYLFIYDSNIGLIHGVSVIEA